MEKMVIKLNVKLENNGEYYDLVELPPNTTSYIDPIILQRGISYYYRVFAFTNKTEGHRSLEGNVSLYMATPSRPKVIINSIDTVRIEWNDKGINQIGYILERSVDEGDFQILAKTNKDENFYLDTDIDTLNSYSYRVRSYTNYNESNNSPVIKIKYFLSDIKLIKSISLGSPVNSLAFNADGSMLAASGMSYALKIWNTNDFSILQNLSYYGSEVSSLGWPFQVAFSSDGSLIASNSNNSSMNIWKVQTGELLSQISVSGGARSICFTDDNKYVIAGNFVSTIGIWNISDGTLYKTLNTPRSSEVINFIYITHDNKKLIVGNYGFPGDTNEGIQIWNPKDWSKLTSINGFQSGYYTISWDENYIVTDNDIRYALNGSKVMTFQNQPPLNGEVCLTYDNNYYISKYFNGNLTIGEVQSGKILLTKSIISPNNYTYPAIKTSPRSYMFAAVGNSSGSIDIWKLISNWHIE